MNRKRVLVTLGALVMLVPQSVWAGEGNKESDYHTITDRFFAKLADGKASEAVEYLFGLNPYMTRKADDIAQVKSQIVSTASMLGEYEGQELVLERQMGTRFVNLTYLAFYDRQPIRLNFQFYKVKNAWLTYSFTFEDRFASELAEAAKAESLLSPDCRKK
ncbi:MAG: hypothetical protein ABSG54_08265 [Terriglobia bacterium]|jgi:hypothetical protein